MATEHHIPLKFYLAAILFFFLLIYILIGDTFLDKLFWKWLIGARAKDLAIFQVRAESEAGPGQGNTTF